MFLDATILILQELLEAALLFGVLLVLTRRFALLDKENLDPRWIPLALLFGATGATALGMALPVISGWFDYRGFEIVSALLQGSILCALLAFAWLPDLPRPWPSVWLLIVVACGIAHEGSEILLYVQGTFGQAENVMPVMLGLMMAAGIGLSSIYLLYSGLLALPLRWALRMSLLLLALFAGNTAAQVVLLLTQADWLPATAPLWDSTALLSEAGIGGHLMYALIGYDANPSAWQVGAYAGVLMLVALSPLFHRAWSTSWRPSA